MNVETSLSKNNKKNKNYILIGIRIIFFLHYHYFSTILCQNQIMQAQNQNLLAKFEYLQKENQKLKNDIEFLKKKK
jgi:cell division protein FtsB